MIFDWKNIVNIYNEHLNEIDLDPVLSIDTRNSVTFWYSFEIPTSAIIQALMRKTGWYWKQYMATWNTGLVPAMIVYVEMIEKHEIYYTSSSQHVFVLGISLKRFGDPYPKFSIEHTNNLHQVISFFESR